MSVDFPRREFLGTVTAAGLAPRALKASGQPSESEPLYRISLAQWALNQPLFGPRGD